jgi:hypothetical protein
VNDAVAYGVAIEPATVAPGAWYWQAVRVHHLTPEENGGRHHIFLDVFDPTLGTETNPLGGRVFNARLKVTWQGGEQIVTIDKPLNEPGTNFPMWKWQVCAVQALGLPGQELPSDRVTGLHTGHPDEAPGNTLFHHSFSITFCKVRVPEVARADSVIYGTIQGAAGRTAVLMREGETMATQVLGSDGAFRFTDLAAGTYVIGIEGTPFRSDPIMVTGEDIVRVDLTLAESVLSGRVRNGAGRTVILERDNEPVASALVEADESYRFANLPAGTYRVVVEGTPVRSGPVVLDGLNTGVADLVAPKAGKLLPYYVLFGPADQPATQANLLLAQEFLLTFGPTFGFSPEEAANAGMVTIIADTQAVSRQVELELGLDGTPVQRIAGSVAEVAAALAARVAAGQPFV